jgi:excisionase family DNA binding protein
MSAIDKLLESVDEVDHLTVKEASELLGRTEAAVRILIQRSAINVERTGERVWIPRSEVDRLLLRAEHKAEVERLSEPGALP